MVQQANDDDWQDQRNEVVKLVLKGDAEAFNRLVELLKYPNLAVSVDAVEALLVGWEEEGLRAVLIAAFEGDAQTRGWFWLVLHEQTDFGPGRIEDWIVALESLGNERLTEAITAYRSEPW